MSTADSGFVLLHRKLLGHPLMSQLPAAWLRVWIVILLRASWRNTTWWDGEREVQINRGSFVTSLDRLAKASGSSVRQVRGALKYFQAAGMVTCRTTYRHTVLTILNWDSYQAAAPRDDKANDKPEGIVRARSGQDRGMIGATDNNSIREKTRASASMEEDQAPTSVKLPDFLGGAE